MVVKATNARSRSQQFPTAIFFALDRFIMRHPLVGDRLMGFDETLSFGEIPQPTRTVVAIMHQQKIRHALFRFRDDAEFVIRQPFQNMAQAREQRSSVQSNFPMSRQHDWMGATEIVSEETGRLKMAVDSEMTHVFFYRLNKFHPPSQITWQANFREVDEFLIRHWKSRSELYLITAKTFRSLAPCFG